MIGSHLEGADLESRVASWSASATVKRDLAAARATSQGTITVRATGETQPARLRRLFVLEHTGGNWEITQYMYLPEQPGGDCSGI